MKIVPFPVPMNIGTDIVHIPRIYRMITRNPFSKTSRTAQTFSPIVLDRFTRRILTDQEREYFHSKFPPLRNRSPPAPSSTSAAAAAVSLSYNSADAEPMARWLAGRFAAKEAARKAAPGGAASVGWKDVMIRLEEGGDGRPELVYLRDGGRIGKVGRLSISHDGEYVVATVIAADVSK
jgi:holo-[acyl-carrier protein] synthase